MKYTVETIPLMPISRTDHLVTGHRSAKSEVTPNKALNWIAGILPASRELSVKPKGRR